MLTFLTPAALFGLFLLAVPIVVHLFKPRKMRRMPYSSLRWLRATQQRFSRRIQWHQLLLFAVRAAFITLLVMALAHPIVGGRGAALPVDRYVVVDVSRSMGYRVEGQPTPLDRAKEYAASLLQSTGPGDRAALLFAGAHTRLVMPPTPDPEPILPVLKGVEASATDTRLGSTLTVLRPFVEHPREGADAEIVLVTDVPRRGWSQPAIADFTRGLSDRVRVRVVNTGIAGGQNAWVSSVRRVDHRNDSVLEVELGACGEQASERTLRVIDLPGDERTLRVTPLPGQVTSVEFELPDGADLKDTIAEIRLEPADALPQDDVLWINLDTAGRTQVLLVEGAAAGGERGSRLHLRHALEAQVSAGDRPFELVTRASDAVTVPEVESADVVLLAGIPDLSETVVAALRQRVRAGAGLIVFLGDAVRPTFYNEELYSSLKPAEGLLPAPLATRAEFTRLSRLTHIDYGHRWLAAHEDPLKGDLAEARFSACYHFAANPGADDVVLARLEDETPLLIEHPLGVGRVLLFNTSADDAWGTLPRCSSFVPLVDQAIGYLTAGGLRREFVAGEPVNLPLPGWKPGDKLVVRGPGDVTFQPAVIASGSPPQLHLDELAVPGIYTVERDGGESTRFVVNVGHEDSLLVSAEPQELAAWWQPASLNVASVNDATRELVRGGSPVLWQWLIGLAVGLLLLETFLVHYLCPRVNPAAAEVLVNRSGLLRPVAAVPPRFE